jgi:hypothetical protein
LWASLRRSSIDNPIGGFTRQPMFSVRARGAGMIWCMIKRSLLASIIFGAPLCLASAQDAKVSVDMVGIGSMSCAHWRSTNEHLLEGTVWIHGFWTGLNYVAAASGQTQPRISVSSIVAEVENACARKTSQTLASAVWTTYLGATR